MKISGSIIAHGNQFIVVRQDTGDRYELILPESIAEITALSSLVSAYADVEAEITGSSVHYQGIGKAVSGKIVSGRVEYEF